MSQPLNFQPKSTYGKMRQAENDRLGGDRWTTFVGLFKLHNIIPTLQTDDATDDIDVDAVQGAMK